MKGGNKYAAEFIGTFALVFAGTGAIIINDVSGGAVTNVGIGLTFGMIILTMIYAVGDVSGAHFNPAVTVGFFAARRLEAKMIFPYVFSQLSGAVTASLLFVDVCDPQRFRRCQGTRNHRWYRRGSRDCTGSAFCRPDFRCIDESGTLLAPALVSQHLANLWIYLVAPVTGALIAVVGCRCIRKDCCSVPLHGRIDQVS